MKREEHLDFEDYMELTESVLNTGSIENLDEDLIDHLRACPDCNATAASFLKIHRYIEQTREKEREGLRRRSGQRDY